MRLSKWALLSLVLGLSTASAWAISPGPGGRLWANEASTFSNGVVVGSYLVGSDWLVNPYEQHTVLRERMVIAPQHYAQDLTPVFVKHAGTGYGTVTMGIFGTGAPLTANPGNNGSGPKPYVMNIVQVSDISLKVVGSGRAYVDASTPCTDGGLFAWYDRSGMLTGTRGSYVAVSAWGWDANISVLPYRAGNLDITDADDDYALTQIRSWNDDWYTFGHSQLGNRLYTQATYASMASAEDGGRAIYYTYLDTVNNKLAKHDWYNATLTHDQDIELTFLSMPAAGKVKQADGTYRDATWAVTTNTAGDSSAFGISLMVDKNNDGDANDAGEVSTIINNSSPLFADLDTAPNGFVQWDGSDKGTRCLRFVRGPQGNNFLIWNNSKQYRLSVIELNADGTWKGAGAADPAQFFTSATLTTMKDWINFDYYVPGDANTDYVVNGQDIFGFLKALSSEDAFWAAMPNAKTIQGVDVNEDGVINGQDIKPFIDALGGQFPSAAPEPATMCLLGLGGIAALLRRNRK